MTRCDQCSYGVWGQLENAEEELQAALKNRNYDGPYVTKVVGNNLLELFQVSKQGKEKYAVKRYEEKIRLRLKEALKKIAKWKREISQILWLEMWDTSLDSSLWTVKPQTIKEMSTFFWEYREKYIFLFWSPEDRKANLNAFLKETPASVHTVTVSIKDICKKYPSNVVDAFWETVRQKLLKMRARYSWKDKNEESYKNVSLYEILRKGYWADKDYLSCPTEALVVIPDLEELFQLSSDEIADFFRIYEVLIGKYTPCYSSTYIYCHSSKLFPKDDKKMKEVSQQDMRATRFIGCGGKDTVADFEKLNDNNRFSFLDRNHFILS